MDNQIELSCGFGELSKNLDGFGEMGKWESNAEIERHGEIENQLPTIQENENDLGDAFLEIGENGRGQIPSLTQRETNVESSRTVESGGAR